MKVTDLMIGDWVAYSHKYMSNLLLCEVISIDAPHGELVLRYLQSEKVDAFGNKDYKVIKTRYEDVSPIPLTLEILEKNAFAFRKDNDTMCGVYYLHNQSTFAIKIFNGYLVGMCMDEDLEFHYVHELQHALRLCGLDDIADHFKV